MGGGAIREFFGGRRLKRLKSLPWQHLKQARRATPHKKVRRKKRSHNRKLTTTQLNNELHINSHQHQQPTNDKHAMPKSKRNKVVSLTKTEKKPGRENNERLFNKIRESIDQYQTCLVFSIENMRNTHLKEVRTDLSDSRCVFCLPFARIEVSANLVHIGYSLERLK